MKKITSTLLTVVMSLTLCASFAFAKTTNDEGFSRDNSTYSEPGHGRHHRRMNRLKVLADKLGLSDEQRAQIRQIHENHREAILPLKKELRQKMSTMREATANGTFNEALVTQKLQETAGLRAKLMGEKFKIHQETLAVLTPEQKSKWEQMRQEFKDRRAERHQKNF